MDLRCVDPGDGTKCNDLITIKGKKQCINLPTLGLMLRLLLGVNRSVVSWVYMKGAYYILGHQGQVVTRNKHEVLVVSHEALHRE